MHRRFPLEANDTGRGCSTADRPSDGSCCQGGKGLQGGWFVPPCFSAGREQAKTAPSHRAHLESPLRAPSRGVWGRMNSRQQGGELAAQAARVPSRAWEKIPRACSTEQTCPVMSRCAAASGASEAVLAPPLICPQQAAWGQSGCQHPAVPLPTCASPGVSRAADRAVSVRCSVLGRQLLLVALRWGHLLHPAPWFAAGSQHGHPVPLSWARVAPVCQEQCAVPLPGHFTGSCGCSFACRVLGRASLPPLHGCRGHG